MKPPSEPLGSLGRRVRAGIDDDQSDQKSDEMESSWTTTPSTSATNTPSTSRSSSPVRTGARREIPEHFRNPFLSDEYLNGYGKFLPPKETRGVVEKKKRALMVTMSNIERAGELQGVIYDAWAMKRFLSAQGYEVVWLKDFTMLREQVKKTIYEKSDTEMANAEATHKMFLAKAQAERDPIKADRFRKAAEVSLTNGTKYAQNIKDMYEKYNQFPGTHEGDSKCYRKANHKNKDEDEAKYYATMKNIEDCMKAIVAKTREGDSTFFYYSGHGGRFFNTNVLHIPVPERSTLEKIFDPLGWITAARKELLTDTYIHDKFLVKLPKGSQAVMMFDSCHSGRQANLQNRAVIEVSEDDKETLKWLQHSKDRKFTPNADVISISGCDDKQESVDGENGGYLTNAFLEVTGWRKMVKDGGLRIKKEYEA